MYAATTLAIGAKMAKSWSLLAAGLLLDPRQRGDRRLAGTGTSTQHLQNPRIQRQRWLISLPLQPVLIHHLPQPSYGAEKSAFAQYTSTRASATPPWKPAQETGGSGRSTCSDTASTAETSASSAMLSRAAANAVADSGEHLPELEAQLQKFGRGIGDVAEHGSGCRLAPPRMPLQRGGNKPPPATRQGEHQQGGFSLSGALRWRWAGGRPASGLDPWPA